MLSCRLHTNRVLSKLSGSVSDSFDTIATSLHFPTLIRQHSLLIDCLRNELFVFVRVAMSCSLFESCQALATSCLLLCLDSCVVREAAYHGCQEVVVRVRVCAESQRCLKGVAAVIEGWQWWWLRPPPPPSHRLLEKNKMELPRFIVMLLSSWQL